LKGRELGGEIDFIQKKDGLKRQRLGRGKKSIREKLWFNRIPERKGVKHRTFQKTTHLVNNVLKETSKGKET